MPFVFYSSKKLSCSNPKYLTETLDIYPNNVEIQNKIDSKMNYEILTDIFFKDLSIIFSKGLVFNFFIATTDIKLRHLGTVRINGNKL